MGLGTGYAQDENLPPEGIERGIERSLIQIAANKTGMLPQDILLALGKGKVLGDLLDASDSLDAFIAEATTMLTEEITAAARDGLISQARADHLFVHVEGMVSRLIFGAPSIYSGESQVRRPTRRLIQLAAEQTGQEASIIIGCLRNGFSLAEILCANGVHPDQFVDLALRDQQLQFDRQVESLRRRLTEHIHRPQKKQSAARD